MSTNPNMAGFAGALDKMSSGLAAGMQNREQAQLDKKQAQQKIDTIDYQTESGAMEAKVDEATAIAQETTRKLQKANMFRGLKSWSEDRNPRHLNALLKGGPMSKSGITRFAKIDTSADTALMSSAGLDMEDVQDEHGDSARFVKGIMQDGTEKVFDLFKVKQMTGYFQNLNDKQVTRELAINETRKIREGKTYSPGALEKDSRWAASQGVEGGDVSKTTNALFTDRVAGNTPGQLELAEERTAVLQKDFGGDFLTNFESDNPQHRELAYPHIIAIENLEGVKFGPAERKELRNIAVLTALGEPGGSLTEDETGIIDTLLSSVNRYVSNEGGSEEVAAYAAFRNSFRHAIAGTALTEFEIKAFNEQLGTRRQQLGPLIKQMRSAMTQIRGKLNSIATMQNPYSARFRLGMPQEKVDDIIAAMDERITYLTDLSTGKATSLSPEAQQDKDSRIIGDVWGK